MYSILLLGQAVMHRLWSGRSEIQISGRSNRTQRCKRLATAATFFRNGAVLPEDAMTRSWFHKLVTRFGVLQRVQ